MISDDTIKKTISKNITKYRKIAGLSQKEFAAKLGAAPSRVSSWETGANSTDIDTLFKICNILNVSINDMCEIYPDANVMLSYLEQEHIKNYRSLDDFGRERIDYELKKECERVKEIEELKNKLDTEFSSEIVPYPYLGKIACAGTGFYFDDIPTEIIKAPYAEGADFIIGVSGESMEPDYYDGEKLYVKKAEYLKKGDVGIFTINNQCFLKELGDNGLISKNEKYNDILGSEDVRLIGKVIDKVKEC